MNRISISAALIDDAKPARPADWLWRPWYAKLWWAAIPLYWAGALLSRPNPSLQAFYDSVPAAYLNLLFFPPTVLVVLGVGYVRAWLDARPAGDGPLSLEEIEELERIRIEEEYWLKRLPGDPDPSVDIYDPMSGTVWIGNPLNPLNSSHTRT